MFSWGFGNSLALHFHSSKGLSRNPGVGLRQDSCCCQLTLGECVLLVSARNKAGQVTKLESRLRWLEQSTILMATSSRQVVQYPGLGTVLATW